MSLKDEMQVYDNAEGSPLTDETESYDDLGFVVQDTGELLGSMYESVSQLDVKNVKIINKILIKAEVAELLSQADALILPLATFYKSGKPYRGMSSKLYEYQAVSKSIISCSYGVPSTNIKETCSGLAVNSGDPDSLAKAVLNLKLNPTLAKAMGENGRRYVENNVSLKAVGMEMKEIFLSEKESKIQTFIKT